ncbi:MAG TPA: cyclic 2,3-diphosphoglycerate synthase [Bacteroidota bacterium]|nr:cyclic 2,3-diphosphoglycerate synthase [Bacteroidota bacterium]
MRKTRILIMGAAGRDFHNFNTLYRDSRSVEVVAFTATQIPNIEGRKYPAKLAGKLYPRGIRIYPEADLPELIRKLRVDEVVFSYSDVAHTYVMNRASLVMSLGADFRLLGVEHTMLRSRVPVIAVVAVRTGSGKSQTSRRVCAALRAMGKRVVAVRHPMPYGDLVRQRVQRYGSIEDLRRFRCTVEEMEEYEPHIVEGTVIYAGVDYGAILAQAEKEADVIVWDGGNNDTSFYRADLTFTVVDPHRAGHELLYYPGETNVRLADVIVVNKIDSAPPGAVDRVLANVATINPRALVVKANSAITVDDESVIRGKSVLVVEDGPTLTHGGMQYGAGTIAARMFGAASIIDPRPYAVASIAATYEKYPGTGTVLPAMGYGDGQVKDLETTINAVPSDAVVIGTPIDLRRVLGINRPSVRVSYALQEVTRPDVAEILSGFFARRRPKRRGR